jgi:hypothetical protein
MLKSLMKPSDAQWTDVAHLRDFLSASELIEFYEGFHSWQHSNVNEIVYRGVDGNLEKGGPWRTSYLHTDGYFRTTMPLLCAKILLAMQETDMSSWQVLKGRSPGTLNFRTVEYHEYGVGGQLSRGHHYDAGSLLTLDIMLTDPQNDFQGGQFVTPHEDGSCDRFPEFRKGDALLFVSHKYHNITPVTKGIRRVLVVELWAGPEKTCPHRCNTTDPCTVSSDWFCEFHCGFASKNFKSVEEHEHRCSLNPKCDSIRHSQKKLKTGHSNQGYELNSELGVNEAMNSINISGHKLPGYDGNYRKMPALQNKRHHYKNESGISLFYYAANNGGDEGWSLDVRNVDGSKDFFDGGFLMSSPGEQLKPAPPIGKLFWQGREYQGFLELAAVGTCIEEEGISGKRKGPGQ